MRLGELTQSRGRRGRDVGPTVNEVSLVFHVPSFWLGICEAGNLPGVWWRASLEGSEIEMGPAGACTENIQFGEAMLGRKKRSELSGDWWRSNAEEWLPLAGPHWPLKGCVHWGSPSLRTLSYGTTLTLSLSCQAWPGPFQRQRGR